MFGLLCLIACLVIASFALRGNRPKPARDDTRQIVRAGSEPPTGPNESTSSRQSVVAERGSDSPPSAHLDALDSEKRNSRREHRSLPSVAEETKGRRCRTRCGAPCLPDGACPPRCSTNADCADDETCFFTFSRSSGAPIKRCIKSDCTLGEDDCPTGRHCIALPAEARVTYHCVRTGMRGLGEPCMMGGETGDAQLLIASCGRGLFCANGVCLPSTCKVDADCRNGRCRFVGLPPTRMCLPYCDGDEDCEEDARCVRGEFLGSKCLPRETPTTCLETGCAPGEFCYPHIRLAELPVAECRPACEDDRSCGGGQTCVPFETFAATAAACLPICNSDASCREGFVCRPTAKGRPAICLPNGDTLIRDYYESLAERPSPPPQP